jgi:DNA-directed RNA polymerase I, II, and III subunit RPABC2
MPPKLIQKKTVFIKKDADVDKDTGKDAEQLIFQDIDTIDLDTVDLEKQVPKEKEEKQEKQEKQEKEVQVKIVKKKVSIEGKAAKTIKVDEKEIQKPAEVLTDISKISKTPKKSSKKHDHISTDLFNDDDIDYRYIMTNYDFTKNKSLPKITKYEKALLVGKRAKQIEDGANPNVKVLPGQNAIEIAEEELRQRKIPFIIKRPMGNKFEYWKPADMEVIMD